MARLKRWRFRRRFFRVFRRVGPYGAFHTPLWSAPPLGYESTAGRPRYWDLKLAGVPFVPLYWRGPRWREAWGVKAFRSSTRKWSRMFISRMRAGLFQTSPAIAVEMLLESPRYAELSVGEQAAALRDVIDHYGPGRRIHDGTATP